MENLIDNILEYLANTEANAKTNSDTDTNSETDTLSHVLNAEKLTEAWKPIQGFPKYQVSDLGRIKNIESGRIFTGTKDAFGYKHVRLINPKGTYTLRKVHRLVAEAFLPNPEGKPIIDHIDGDKTNNALSNLRWFTYSENSKAYEASKGKRRSTPINRMLAQYTLDGKLVAVYDNALEAARTTGFGDFGIYSAGAGKLKSFCGFQWRFFDGKPESTILPFEDKRRKAVYCIQNGERTLYPSIAAAAKELLDTDTKLKDTKLSSVMMNISANLHGKTNEAYGRTWRYA